MKASIAGMRRPMWRTPARNQAPIFQSGELFGAELDERLFIQRWLARHFSFPLISVARRFARQRVVERSIIAP
jgi:hypothetical protein